MGELLLLADEAEEGHAILDPEATRLRLQGLALVAVPHDGELHVEPSLDDQGERLQHEVDALVLLEPAHEEERRTLRPLTGR